MTLRHVIITGSSGLVGSEAVTFFCQKGYTVIGIDNDMRKYFFGTTTADITSYLMKKHSTRFIHYDNDIRDMVGLEKIFIEYKETLDCIIHCAAQPSHDWAAKEPHTDFSVNAFATLNLLELTRKHVPKASFIFMSTNKVYGDNPNNLQVVELPTRYEVEGHGIDESMSVDNCKHSIFGASKLAADIMVQEYGRYFGMNTVVFRGGCITGPHHQGAQLHGFLSYLIKCIASDNKYTIFGYKGKQVRDNIHAYDLVNAFWHYHTNPRPGAIYNMGGGRENSLSIIETIDIVNKMLQKNWSNYTYVDENRSGDHIWYITDFRKFQKDYPEWSIQYPIERILKDIICFQSNISISANFLGGIGNQLFQAATAYSLSRKLNLRLQFVRGEFGGCRQGSHPTKYYDTLFEKLDFIDSPPPTIVMDEKRMSAYPVIDDAKQILNLNPQGHMIRLNGYYQSEQNFKEYVSEIRDLFTPAIGIIPYLKEHTNIFSLYPELLGDTSDFAFIGVRRGDYITYAHNHLPCGMTYYNKAMAMMSAKCYYIMTDDLTWCKQKFVGDQYKFIELNDDLEKLFVIMLFKNYIISNSSFYWWGSYLSQNQPVRVIAPDKWVVHETSIYRDDMIILERPVETD